MDPYEVAGEGNGGDNGMAGYTHNSNESLLHGNDHMNAACASRTAPPPNDNSVRQQQANSFEMQNMFYNGVHHMQLQNSTQSSAGSYHLNQSGNPQQLQWDQHHSHHQNQNSTMAFVANNSAPFSSIPRNLSPIPGAKPMIHQNLPLGYNTQNYARNQSANHASRHPRAFPSFSGHHPDNPYDGFTNLSQLPQNNGAFHSAEYHQGSAYDSVRAASGFAGDDNDLGHRFPMGTYGVVNSNAPALGVNSFGSSSPQYHFRGDNQMNTANLSGFQNGTGDTSRLNDTNDSRCNASSAHNAMSVSSAVRAASRNVTGDSVNNVALNDVFVGSNHTAKEEKDKRNEITVESGVRKNSISALPLPSRGRGLRGRIAGNNSYSPSVMSVMGQGIQSISQSNSRRGPNPLQRSNGHDRGGPAPAKVSASSPSPSKILKKQSPKKSPPFSGQLKDPPDCSQVEIKVPVNVPQKSLPPLPKQTGQVPVSHHPDVPFLVTHWLAQYAQACSNPSVVSSHKLTQSKNENRFSGFDETRQTVTHEEAMERIRKAALDLAWAFEALGAYGQTVKLSPSTTTNANTSPTIVPASFADIYRKYASTISSSFAAAGRKGDESKLNMDRSEKVALLDSLVSASSATNAEVSRNILEKVMPWSLLEAAQEGSVPTNESLHENNDGSHSKTAEIMQKSGKSSIDGAGRRVGDSMYDEIDESLKWLIPPYDTSGVVLQNPVLLGHSTSDAEAASADKMSASYSSNFDNAAMNAAKSSRQYNALRSEAAKKMREIEAAMKDFNLAKTRVITASSSDNNDKEHNSQLDRNRVVDQLRRRLGELQMAYNNIDAKATQAKKIADSSYRHLSTTQSRYQDPYKPNHCIPSNSICSIYSKKVFLRNSTLCASTSSSSVSEMVSSSILLRRYQCRHLPLQRHSQNIKSTFLKSRLSHAITISCHLFYPVYCLRFDKTGQYFVTGADDQIVKVFRLGVGSSRMNGNLKETSLPFNYCANMRGAVLVCTLRGHAGVIADIDVSADNAMLATASGDGDVRVWGLRDGSPIAILRGHREGANMVSWSALTPFRLVTCGEDGLARIWDIRGAALTRYGNIISKRSDYRLPQSRKNNPAPQQCPLKTSVTDDAEMALDPIEQQSDEQGRSGAGSNVASNRFPNLPSNIDQHEGINVAVPPLPPGAEGFGGGANQEADPNVINRANPGDFVANDEIDEGVELLAQLQHGDFAANIQQGVNTRGRRKAVKVMCITRCPVGGHFATGSDDGLGRIWADDDDTRVESIDADLRESTSSDGENPRVQPLFVRNQTPPQKSNLGNTPSKERLLATLAGHNNAITDMKYSSAGDRILTASMKDGVARIWSWSKEKSIRSDGSTINSKVSDFRTDKKNAKFENLSQLLIRLTPINDKFQSSSSKRKTASSATSNQPTVNCDGVAWTCDDMKVVTSQSSPLKTNGTDIVPGSHMFFVWDSRTGQCLMGISSSHDSLCSTVVSHPFIPSIVATAGSDGVVNVWDLENGERFFTHKNLLTHGPVEPASDRGKPSGYLDGQFSPDGSYLVFTDENGRVTIFDTMVSPTLKNWNKIGANEKRLFDRAIIPEWMNEQYFANDYYDLFYDDRGYCVERGSAKPPHLAPRGARCAHDGVAYPEEILETFSNLKGPLPLPDNDVRWERDNIRFRSMQVRANRGILSKNVRSRFTKVVESPGLFEGSRTTAIMTSDGELWHSERREVFSSKFKSIGQNSGSRRQMNGMTCPERPLSSRYQWRDFNDIPDDEEDFDDKSDEDYTGGAQGDIGNGNDEESCASSDDGSEHRKSGSKSKAHQQQQQPTRTSSRRRPVRNFTDSYSDDDELVQMMSTHTEPSGEYSEDWTQSNHYFKMPRESLVHRKWVTRTTFEDHCLGQKMYCPQVGDSVVYIPRAHYEILQKYPIPGYSGPWKSWQTQSNWHAVRCRVTHIRYRFPYEMYYRSRVQEDRLRSVAAVLTLEITGIPSSSAERNIPWPYPSFVSAVSTRTRSHDSKFEVTLFECNQEDFIIPEYLYTWRLRALENAIGQNGGEAGGIEVRISFPPENNKKGNAEDPKFVWYNATLRCFSYEDNCEFHLQNSGFNALSLQWPDGNDDDDIITAPAWSVDVKGSLDSFPQVPTLSDEITAKIFSALDKVQDQDSSRRDIFRELVDTEVYTDYLDMIEVPMYLDRIRKRLRCKYYTNKDSVVADMEVLRENCYKYNEEGNGYYAVASQMYDDFKALVDAIVVPQTLTRDDSGPFNSSAQDFSTSIETVKCAASLSTKSRRRNQTQSSSKNNSRVSRSSVFENLPHLGSTESSLSVERSNNYSDVHSPRRSLRSRRLSAPRNNSFPYDGNSTNHKNQSKTISSARSHDAMAAVHMGEQVLSSPRRSLRTTRQTLDHAVNHESEVTESKAKPARSTRHQGNAGTSEPSKRSTRSSSRCTTKPIYIEEGSDEDDFSDSSQSSVKVKTSDHISQKEKNAADDESCLSDAEKTKITKLRLRVRSSKSSNQPSAAVRENPDGTKREIRSSSRSKSNPSYAEKSSDDDDFSDCTHQSSDVSVEKRRDEDDSDEYSDYESGHEFSDDERSRINRHRSKRRRSGGDDSTTGEDAKEPPMKRGRPRKKSERLYKNRVLHSSHDSSRKKTVGGYQYYPDLPAWPEINPRKVQRVVKLVLSKLRSLDTENCFENPVHEEYPDMAEEYLNRVSKPMSFSTIEQLQLPNYERVSELQEDLILTFRNCCVFNGEGSDFYRQAIIMWQSINDTFIEACRELQVHLPPRFAKT